MKLNDLHARLIATARNIQPNDKVPYAFEKRVMAHLEARPAWTPWAVWGHSLWKAAASCVAVATICSVFCLVSLKSSEPETFAQEFESTVVADVNQHVEDTW